MHAHLSEVGVAIENRPSGVDYPGNARLVGKGFHQRKGIDYRVVFSRAPIPSSIRMVAVVAFQGDCSLDPWNITGLCSTETDRDVCTSMLEGWDELLSGKIVKLAKTSYGLKQSPRVFSQRLRPKLLPFGLVRCRSDLCFSFDKVRQEESEGHCRSVC